MSLIITGQQDNPFLCNISIYMTAVQRKDVFHITCLCIVQLHLNFDFLKVRFDNDLIQNLIFFKQLYCHVEIL